LVEQIRIGDREAEAALYRRHAPAISRITRRLLGTADEVNDVLHDTFVYALEHVDELRDPSAAGGWLLQIAIRQTHRRFRRKRLLRFLGLAGNETWEPGAQLEDLAAPGVSQETIAELRLVDAVLAKVADAERIAWVLRRVEGCALEEVASACACSLATAKRRIAAVDACLEEHVHVGEGARA
jgi:RNA polymerase sigma-70 factor (ECF subfamily)